MLRLASYASAVRLQDSADYGTCGEKARIEHYRPRLCFLP